MAAAFAEATAELAGTYGAGEAEVTGSIGGAGDATGTMGGTAATLPPGWEELDSHVLAASVKPRLSPEEKLEREVMRRRQMEAERRARIFDAKVRTIGIDKETLDRQCAEKLAKKQAEAHADRIADRQFMGVNRVMQINEKEKNKARTEAERATKEYNLKHLNFESRDVYDLNDPKAVTKATPARLGDTDERCGPASLQQFNGEDLHKEERIRQQKLQFQHTLEQQVFEKRMLEKMNDGGDDEYQKRTQEVIDGCNALDAESNDMRKAIMKQYQADLLASMEAKAQARSDEQEQSQADNQRELDHHSADPFLQENQPHLMPDGKALPGLYKGSTRDERLENFGHQLMQCDEKAMRRHEEGQLDFGEHRQAEKTRKHILILEREKQRMKRAMAMDMSAQNKAMVQTKQDTKAELGRDAHKNKIHPDFFEQFGVGTR